MHNGSGYCRTKCFELATAKMLRLLGARVHAVATALLVSRDGLAASSAPNDAADVDDHRGRLLGEPTWHMAAAALPMGPAVRLGLDVHRISLVPHALLHDICKPLDGLRFSELDDLRQVQPPNIIGLRKEPLRHRVARILVPSRLAVGMRRAIEGRVEQAQHIGLAIRLLSQRFLQALAWGEA